MYYLNSPLLYSTHFLKFKCRASCSSILSFKFPGLIPPKFPIQVKTYMNKRKKIRHIVTTHVLSQIFRWILARLSAATVLHQQNQTLRDHNCPSPFH